MSDYCPHGVRRTWVCATCENEATDMAIAAIRDMIPRAKVREMIVRAVYEYSLLGPETHVTARRRVEAIADRLLAEEKEREG